MTGQAPDDLFTKVFAPFWSIVTVQKYLSMFVGHGIRINSSSDSPIMNVFRNQILKTLTYVKSEVFVLGNLHAMFIPP